MYNLFLVLFYFYLFIFLFYLFIFFFQGEENKEGKVGLGWVGWVSIILTYRLTAKLSVLLVHPRTLPSILFCKSVKSLLEQIL